MALQLYRQGNSHTVRGVVCELKNFHPSELIDALGNGWCRSEKDIETPHDVSANEAERVSESDPVPEMDEAAFRAMAKSIGIKNWHNKKIENLIIEIREYNA